MEAVEGQIWESGSIWNFNNTFVGLGAFNRGLEETLNV